MTDRLINSAWWMALMGIICVAAGAGLLLGYWSLFDLLAGRWQSGIFGASVGLICSIATVQLCRHRNDLLSF